MAPYLRYLFELGHYLGTIVIPTRQPYNIPQNSTPRSIYACSEDNLFIEGTSPFIYKGRLWMSIGRGNKPEKLVVRDPASHLSPAHRVDHLTVGSSFLVCLRKRSDAYI